uniref:Sodium/potassium-transporting ATPase subunit beta n=1 Tax=Heliothis virescens TaxID=7102 RepID=A0A2A4K715_HELVI
MASGHNDETELRPTHLVPKTLPPLPPPGRPSAPIAPREQTEAKELTLKRRILKCIYNKETGQILGRTCKSWACILAYSVMYLLFLGTFFLVLLYSSLQVLKILIDYQNMDKIDPLRYPEHGIGLTAAPTSESNLPLIWYKSGEKNDYDKYVQALDKLLSSNRRKREISNLGPCGQSPYGYGERPCIIIRINKKLNWAGHPLQFNSTIAKSAPAEVQEWMKGDRTKLWLQCSGYHAYDREHIGSIKYFPDPPGYDASVFPLAKDAKSPLVAIQITDFTMGISIAIQCKLWYDGGPSTINFLLYVAPEKG